MSECWVTEVGTNCKKTVLTSTRRQFTEKALDKRTNTPYLCQGCRNVQDSVFLI